VLQVGIGAKRAQALYFELLRRVGNEFHILLEAPLQEISAASSATLARAIGEARRGEVTIDPGYDGKYGTVSVLER
jgi:PHP family Zn ribbon phosphoesterase